MARQVFVHAWSRRVVVAIALAVILVQALVIAHRREQYVGDYDVSREMGRRYLAGEHLYAGGLHYPYTPTAAMSFAPLAMVPAGLGLALRFAAAVAALWLTLRLLRVMVGIRRPLEAAQACAVDALTMVLASQYIIRDLDDGGPHLLLLAMLVGGVYCVWRGHDALGGMWFGLATVLKAPVGLLLPFVLWKRQWRLAALTIAATVVWTVVPMTWMGVAGWWQHQKEWTETALRSILGHPVPGVRASEERVQNQSLKLAVMRYLVTHPNGHSLRLSHPAYVSFGNLDSGTARWIVAGVLGVFLGLCAWRMRRPYRGPDDPAWLLECSAVLILALLLSPVTWTQHLVFVIPALYLIVTEGYAIRPLGVAASGAMAIYAMLALALNREILGRDLSLLVLSYSIHTLALLLVLAVMLLRRPTVD